MTRFFRQLSTLLVALSCFALYSPAQVTVNATLTDGSGTIYRTAYLHFQLVNCGANIPVTTGTTAIIQDSFDLRPSSPGSSISGTVVGNDQILCGNVKSTYYVLTPMKDSTHPLRDGVSYVICSASSTLTTCGNQVTLGTFNLVTANPMSQTPVVPGFTEVYGNPTNSQTIAQPNGTEISFQGTVNFCSANLLCAGGAGSYIIATTFPGSDIFAQANAAAASLGGNPGVVLIPPGIYNAVTTTLRGLTNVVFFADSAKVSFTGTSGCAMQFANTVNSGIRGLILLGPNAGTGTGLCLGNGTVNTGQTLHNYFQNLEIGGDDASVTTAGFLHGVSCTGNSGAGTYDNHLLNVHVYASLGTQWVFQPAANEFCNINVIENGYAQHGAGDGLLLDGVYGNVFVGFRSETNAGWGVQIGTTQETDFNTFQGGWLESNTSGDVNCGTSHVNYTTMNGTNIADTANGGVSTTCNNAVGGGNTNLGNNFDVVNVTTNANAQKFGWGWTWSANPNTPSPRPIFQFFNSEAPPSAVSQVWAWIHSAPDSGSFQLASPEYPLFINGPTKVSGGASNTAGALGFGGGASVPTLGSNQAGFLGPTASSFTSWFCQLPSTAPSSGQVLSVTGSPTGNVYPCGWTTPSSGTPCTSVSNALQFNSSGSFGCAAITDNGSSLSASEQLTISAGGSALNLSASNGKIGLYNGLSSTNNGIAQEVAATNGSSFTNNISATTIFTPAVSASDSLYKVMCYVVETTAASVSSTLPSCSIGWTDLVTSVSETLQITNTNTGNTIGTFGSGIALVHPLQNTHITYSTSGYASNVSGMTYTVFIQVEKM